MSTILDALRKSERERTQVRGVGFGDASRHWVPHTDRSWQWLAASALIAAVVVVAIVAIYGWRHVDADTDTATNATVIMPVPTVSVPVPIEAPVVETGWTAATPATPPAQMPSAGELRFLATLPQSFQQGLPPMQVTIHVFSPNEADRLLYINNQPYRRGDEIGAGVVVDEIVPDGVVLHVRNQRFKLPRPQ